MLVCKRTLFFFIFWWAQGKKEGQGGQEEKKKFSSSHAAATSRAPREGVGRQETRLGQRILTDEKKEKTRQPIALVGALGGEQRASRGGGLSCHTRRSWRIFASRNDKRACHEFSPGSWLIWGGRKGPGAKRRWKLFFFPMTPGYREARARRQRSSASGDGCVRRGEFTSAKKNTNSGPLIGPFGKGARVVSDLQKRRQNFFQKKLLNIANENCNGCFFLKRKKEARIFGFFFCVFVFCREGKGAMERGSGRIFFSASAGCCQTRVPRSRWRRGAFWLMSRARGGLTTNERTKEKKMLTRSAALEAPSPRSQKGRESRFPVAEFRSLATFFSLSFSFSQGNSQSVFFFLPAWRHRDGENGSRGKRDRKLFLLFL